MGPRKCSYQQVNVDIIIAGIIKSHPPDYHEHSRSSTASVMDYNGWVQCHAHAGHQLS